MVAAAGQEGGEQIVAAMNVLGLSEDAARAVAQKIGVRDGVEGHIQAVEEGEIESDPGTRH